MGEKMETKDVSEMTINELEEFLKKAKEIKNKVSKPKGLTYCIIRTDSAGVFAGLIDRKVKGKENTIYNSRKIWYWDWDGANSLSQLANDGLNNPENCKFAQEVTESDLKGIIEIIPCSLKAEKSIKEVKICRNKFW